MSTLLVAAGLAFVSPGVAHADTVRDYQEWYFDELRIPEAHKLSKGRGVVVAVIDSGVDASHPDLKGQVLAGRGIGPDAAVDGRRDPDTDGAHGTGIAGIIAGAGGSEMRVLGIAPAAKILPVSLGPDDYEDSEIAQGIRWAVDNGADVINLSISGPGAASRDLAAAVRYALDKDVVVVAGAGNTRIGMREVGSPANVPGVIAVSGTGMSGQFSQQSVRGPEVVLAAPVEKIIAPNPYSPNGYALTTGTSSSAAIVSGVVALVRSRFPDLDAANVINRLIVTAEDRGPAGRDDMYGFGVVDPVAALTESVPEVRGNPLLPAVDPSAGGDRGHVGEDPASGEGSGQESDFVVNRNPLVWAIAMGGVLLTAVVVVALVAANVRASRRRRVAGPVGAAGAPPLSGGQFGVPGAPPGAPSPGMPPAPGAWPAGPVGFSSQGSPWPPAPGHPAPGQVPRGPQAPPAGPPDAAPPQAGARG